MVEPSSEISVEIQKEIPEHNQGGKPRRKESLELGLQ